MSADTWPTAALSQDHQAVLAKLLELEQTVAWLSEGTASSDTEERVRRVVAFLQGEIPQHFDREEKALFPPLDALGPRWTGLLAVILAEHQGLNDLRANLVAAVGSAEHHPDWNEVRRRADDFIVVLRRHINKEDTMIFPMAEQDLGSERLAAIAAEIHQLGLRNGKRQGEPRIENRESGIGNVESDIRP